MVRSKEKVKAHDLALLITLIIVVGVVGTVNGFPHDLLPENDEATIGGTNTSEFYKESVMDQRELYELDIGLSRNLKPIFPLDDDRYIANAQGQVVVYNEKEGKWERAYGASVPIEAVEALDRFYKAYEGFKIAQTDPERVISVDRPLSSIYDMETEGGFRRLWSLIGEETLFQKERRGIRINYFVFNADDPSDWTVRPIYRDPSILDQYQVHESELEDEWKQRGAVAVTEYFYQDLWAGIHGRKVNNDLPMEGGRVVLNPNEGFSRVYVYKEISGTTPLGFAILFFFVFLAAKIGLRGKNSEQN